MNWDMHVVMDSGHSQGGKGRRGFLMGKWGRWQNVVLKQLSLATRINNKGDLLLNGSTSPRLNGQLLYKHPCRSIFWAKLRWPLCNIVVLVESLVIVFVIRQICVRTLSVADGSRGLSLQVHVPVAQAYMWKGHPTLSFWRCVPLWPALLLPQPSSLFGFCQASSYLNPD